MSASFTVAAGARATPLPHFWEHTVGSGRAALALRADWQAQLKVAHEELGMRHVRFHGILCDDMGTLVCQNERFVYSFFNADQIIDYLLSIGMRPFVELSFMPWTLSSTGQLVFHYRANVSPPADPAQWSALLRRLVSHWVDRYGIDEVSQWFFEVWNEPNLTAFGTGRQEDYFNLYRYSWEAVKGVDARLRVGGPATAANAWIPEFLSFCAASGLSADFVSTHHYPTDAFGKPGDDTVAQLAASPRSILREQARTARAQSGELPLYYTEWCTSSNPRDAMHDDPYAAAFIVKTVLEANGLVDGYSYWTFSDIFEENYFPSIPFHGGFGLQNLHGIAKPAHRAFQLLHGLGEELLEVQGAHQTVDAWYVRAGSGSSTTLVLTNFALPRHPIAAEQVEVLVDCPAAPLRASVQRIDLEHANAKRHWEQLGQPDYLDARHVEELKQQSMLRSETLEFSHADGRLRLALAMPPQAVASIQLDWPA